MTTDRKDAPELSRSEWKAVAIAYDEAEAYRLAPVRRSIFATAIDQLTGTRTELRIEDPRRAALSRFVCTVRRTRRSDERLVPELIAFGFNRAQVDALALLSA